MKKPLPIDQQHPGKHLACLDCGTVLDISTFKPLDLIYCPECKNEVKLDDNKIVCLNCGRRYPVRDGIPVMLVDEAELPEGQTSGK